MKLKAANMKMIKWSDGLAEVAQRWADQCVNGHDEPEAKYGKTITMPMCYF